LVVSTIVFDLKALEEQRLHKRLVVLGFIWVAAALIGDHKLHITERASPVFALGDRAGDAEHLTLVYGSRV